MGKEGWSGGGGEGRKEQAGSHEEASAEESFQRLVVGRVTSTNEWSHHWSPVVVGRTPETTSKNNKKQEGKQR